MNPTYFITPSTPLNRVTLVAEHFDPIERNLGVDPIKQSELILFIMPCEYLKLFTQCTIVKNSPMLVPSLGPEFFMSAIAIL